MREKIASYLENAGQSLPAGQILRDVLNIHSPNSFAADKVLRGILGSDHRFRESHGLWHLVAQTAPPPGEFASLYLQWNKYIPGSFRGSIHLLAPDLSFEFCLAGKWTIANKNALRAARSRAEKHLLVVWSAGALRQWNRLLRSTELTAWAGDSLELSLLAVRSLSLTTPPAGPEDLAPILGLPLPDTGNPVAMARFMSACLPDLLEHAPAGSRSSPTEIRHWIEAGRPKVDFSHFAFGRDSLERIPETPGVYLMRNRSGDMVYVGKSHNLKRRVGSYFTPKALRDPKVARIHSHLHSLECIPCNTEVEALLLEMQMIRDFRPSINLQTEVHEQPRRYGRAHNILLLVPVGEKTEIYFLQEGSFVSRHSAPLGRVPTKRLRTAIRSVYFGSRRRRREPGESWEIEIVERWLSSHRRHLNFVDIDDCVGLDQVMRRLELYLLDPDRLAHKVYYRSS